MRYILSLIVFILLINTGQSQILLLVEDATVISSIDTIPSQFTFTDVTDAALSSYNQGYIVVAGCDSARFYPASGDSLKLGALGTYDVSPIWADAGDSVYTGLVASGTNETATHSIIYSSNGTPYDTFSVTTVAGGGGLPVTPTIYLVHDDDSSVVSGSKTVASVTLNGYTFVDDTADANGKIVQTDSSLYFGYTAGTRRLTLNDAAGNPFDLDITKDMSIDAWVYYGGNGQTGTIMAKGIANDAYWSFGTGLYDDVATPFYTVSNSAQDTVGLIKLDTGTDSLSVGWHHLAAVFDKGVITKIFIDSVVVVTESGAEWSNLANSVINTADPTVIGQTGLGHLAVLRYYFDVILTPANIKAIYEFGRE